MARIKSLHGHEYGGTNPALLKALAYGNCVLALDTVFNREVLEDGKYGILYNKNIIDLADKIIEIDDNEKIVNKYREKSRSRITENYTWEKITKQYSDLFYNILNEHKNLVG